MLRETHYELKVMLHERLIARRVPLDSACLLPGSSSWAVKPVKIGRVESTLWMEDKWGLGRKAFPVS
jgi:hypothetical protein